MAEIGIWRNEEEKENEKERKKKDALRPLPSYLVWLGYSRWLLVLVLCIFGPLPAGFVSVIEGLMHALVSHSSLSLASSSKLNNLSSERIQSSMWVAHGNPGDGAVWESQGFLLVLFPRPGLLCLCFWN